MNEKINFYRDLNALANEVNDESDFLPFKFHERLIHIVFNSQEKEYAFSFHKDNVLLMDEIVDFKNSLVSWLIKVENNEFFYMNLPYSHIWNEVENMSKVGLFIKAVCFSLLNFYDVDVNPDVVKFQEVSDFLFDKINQLRSQFDSLYVDLRHLLDMDRIFTLGMKKLVNVFNKMDDILINLFKVYTAFTRKSLDLITIYHKYFFAVDFTLKNATFNLMLTHSKNDYTVPPKVNTNLDTSQFNIQQNIDIAQKSINRLICEFLNFKRWICFRIVGLRINQTVIDICDAYFTRYKRIELFHQENVYNIVLKFNNFNLASERHEDTEVPLILRDCCKTFLTKSFTSSIFTIDSEKGKLAYRISIAYKNRSLVLPELSPDIAFYLIFIYVNNTRESFFTKKFKKNLLSYVESTKAYINCEDADERFLKEQFNELPDYNKTMVLFIFEHIITYVINFFVLS